MESTRTRDARSAVYPLLTHEFSTCVCLVVDVQQGADHQTVETILWKLFFSSGCVALNEITDKTTCANWVLLQSQSDNDAFALPKGTCVWLYLSADIQGVYCILFVCKEGLCGCACTVHLSLCHWSQCAARVQCPVRGFIRSKEKKNTQEGCAAQSLSSPTTEVSAKGSQASLRLGVTISNVTVSTWPFRIWK